MPSVIEPIKDYDTEIEKQYHPENFDSDIGLKSYAVYIKSHCEYPDYDEQVEAFNVKEAIKYFQEQGLMEFDYETILQNIVELDKSGEPLIDDKGDTYFTE